jgi:putative membrane protein
MFESISILPDFALFFAAGAVSIVVFMTIYLWLTPHHELELVRKGDTAAGFAFGGTLIGYALPVAKAVGEAPTGFDLVLWCAIALVVQIAVYFAVRVLVPDLPRRIEDNNMGAGVFLAAASIAMGLINASAMNFDFSSHAG